MTPAACNLCGSLSFSDVCKPRRHNGPPLGIVRCDDCGLLAVHPFPTVQQLETIYTAAYFHCASPIDGGYENYVEDEPIIRRTFEKRLRMLTPPLPAGGDRSVLDVGCATGVFLDVARAAGWRVNGLEISEFAASAAEKKGIPVERKKLEEAAFSPASFDLITMWDVIEHMADPRRALTVCGHILKPGGHVVLTTPDASALFARLTGTYWMGFRPVGEHVYFFSRKTITRYLESAGFDVVRITAVGKHLPVERLLTRLIYYTRVFRIFRPLQKFVDSRKAIYVNSGDTMCVIARKRGPSDQPSR